MQAQTNELVVDPIKGTLYGVESRPSEAGRSVIVHHSSDGSKRHDVFGRDWSARTGVHEVRSDSLSFPAAAKLRLGLASTEVLQLLHTMVCYSSQSGAMEGFIGSRLARTM